MDGTMYNVMNWPEIEAIVYAEHSNPHSILGAHKVEDGYLISCFFPRAKSVILQMHENQKYEMECIDKEGFYSILIQVESKPFYTYSVTYDTGQVVKAFDPYNFDQIIKKEELKLFEKGVHYTIYERLGAHRMIINGIEGIFFAVWAPKALRVSVVGDFNLWDGRRHPMRQLGESGIYELFIPQLPFGEIYKYEIKVKGGMNILKADPYAYQAELRPATASITCDIDSFQWTDKYWLEGRADKNSKEKPMIIYEVHLGSWKKPSIEGDSAFYNYRELAPMLAEYVIEMGYTHIELLPIMEHPLDASWGYQVTGYYAATARHGSPQDFMYFMNYMHEKGIGVILDWVPAHFPRDAHGLANFDGTCVYEHQDPRRGAHPHWGTLIYNYGKPQVSNFLIANGLFWIEKFHADGIRMDAVASMLYLDYGKEEGEWIPNKYGGKENLEAMEFLKHFNSIVKKRAPGVLVMAEESTAWEGVTKPVEKKGLGFDYKWNMGWMNDFTDYMRTDPLFRKGKHGELTFSMVYAYSEDFILVLSHDEVVHGKCSMIHKMPGNMTDKFANLRIAYGFMMAHPGKKLLFMGQEFAQLTEWNEKISLQWGLLERREHRQMQQYVKVLNRFYKTYPCLYEEDCNYDGFQWISNLDADNSTVSFVRKSQKRKEVLLFVFNFTPIRHSKFRVGVPFHGRYQEVFNSDCEEYGGKTVNISRSKLSKEREWDGREESIEMILPSLGMVVFQCFEIKKEMKKKESQLERIIEEKDRKKILM